MNSEDTHCLNGLQHRLRHKLTNATVCYTSSDSSKLVAQENTIKFICKSLTNNDSLINNRTQTHIQ
jgi:hypothetical protein